MPNELTVHFVRLDGSCYIEQPTSLVHSICDEDGKVKFPHNIFECSPDQCATSNIVDTKDVGLMTSTEGVFTVVETHGVTPVALYYISIVISVASAIYAYSVAGNIEQPESLGSISQNNLSSASNVERIGQRIEDIAGLEKSTPTLIQLPYRKWIDGVEVEYMYMCISIGEGVPDDVLDGFTPVRTMSGSGANIYGPFKSPNNAVPDYTYGDLFIERLKVVRRSNEVSGGEVLKTSADFTIFIDSGQSTCIFDAVNDRGRIDKTGGSYAYDEFFSVGDLLTLANYVVLDDPDNYVLSGDYEVYDIASDFIVFTAAGGGGVTGVAPDWALVSDNSENDIDAEIKFTDPTEKLYTTPFFLSADDIEAAYFNYSANGLIRDNGTQITIEVAMQWAESDALANQVGTWSTEVTTSLSAATRNKVGETLQIDIDNKPYVLVRTRRITPRQSNAINQDVTIDALYSIEDSLASNFGNVTTIQTRVLQSQRASQIKERKINLRWTRSLPVIANDGSIGASAPTRRFCDYFYYMSLSDKIGRRESYEIDAKDLVDRQNEIEAYFGSADAAEFNYTFDDEQTSYQDFCNIISSAVFSQAVRKNGVITTKFERPTSPKTIFTHRTKIPNSQTITRAFNSGSINDGVELVYTDLDDFEKKTVIIPQTALRPLKKELVGVKNKNQAYWIAYRDLNKLKYRKLSLVDTFTTEGQLLSIKDVAGVTNDTKARPQGGEILAVNGLQLTLSQPAIFADGDTHTIMLRKRDGSIEAIGCTNATAYSESSFVLLDSSPSEPIYTGDEEVRTQFNFYQDQRSNADLYLFDTINRRDPNAVAIEAINYDERYYQNDGEDFS